MVKKLKRVEIAELAAFHRLTSNGNALSTFNFTLIPCAKKLIFELIRMKKEILGH
jgi:hypothetical protein